MSIWTIFPLQAMIALHLWVSKSGRVSTIELERALKRIGRNDVIDRYIYGIGIESDDNQMTNGKLMVHSHSSYLLFPTQVCI